MESVTNSRRKSLFHSLRTRLVVMALVVALIAVAGVALLSRRSALIQFQQYVTTNEVAELEGFRAALTAHYLKHAGWDDAQDLLDSIGRQTDKQLILVDAERKVLAASPRDLLQSHIQITPQNDLTLERDQRRGKEIIASQVALRSVPHIVLSDASGTQVGILYAARIMPEQGNRREDIFVGSFNRALLLATLASVSVALLCSLFLAHRIIRPLDLLTRAVRRMESGDTTQRVNITGHDEIGELGRAFNSMADHLARGEQLRRNMVNDIAHELRTPLTNIRCQLEALQDGLAKPTDTIDSLHDEAMLLNYLIEDLQELALAEAGELSVVPTRVSVREEVFAGVGSVQSQIDQRALSLEIDIPENCPDVLADRKRLSQVIRNLLNNAITHTLPGGVIRISAAPIDSFVQWVIEDTGSGIAPEDLPYVFERFYRADASRARATGGSGLGLAIVKQIVAAHRGQTWVESSIGNGTRVYFTLPASRSEPSNSGRTSS